MKTRLLYSIIAAGILVALFPAGGDPYGIPKTAQSSVYHFPSYYDLGDDGACQAGYPLTGRRILAFEDHNNGTVSDLTTGLMWQKSDSFSQEFGGHSSQMTWEKAFDYVAALNVAKYGGYNNWRLPNIKELLSISNKGTWLPSGYYIFDTMQNQPYWSGTVRDGGERAFIVRFSEAFIETTYMIDTAFVKAVRSYYATPGEEGFPKTGQETSYHPENIPYDLGDDGACQAGYPTTGDSFADNGDDTVTQTATDLIWQQTDSHTQSFGNQTGLLSWEDAFAYVVQMNKESFAGYSDWRLPNYFELAGLVDFGRFWPSIDPLFKDDTQKNWYWSSTTRFGPGDFAWAVTFSGGDGVTKDKNSNWYVRAVRGGAYIAPTATPVHPTPTPDPATIRGLPKTGQTTIVHSAGTDDPGDDGITQIGYPLSGSRFAAGSQRVIDNATGLMWQKAESSTQPFGGLSGEITWEKAFEYVAAMNSEEYAGYDDWRMPNVKELASILDLGKWNPAVNTEVFSGTRQDAGYWGSSIYADLVNGRTGYQVTFSEGIGERPNLYETPPPTGYAKAVRSVVSKSGNLGFPQTGQTIVMHYPSGNDQGDDGAIQAGYPATGVRFQDNGNGTITDRASQLIWQKANSAHQQVGPYSGRLPWEDAFNYVREMNIRHVSGYSNWRLPNFQELLSLCDYSQFCPAVDPIFKHSMETGIHWTSTSRLLDSDWHWAIGISCGGWTFYHSDELAYVIAVLGGPGQSPGPTVTTPTPTPPGYHTPSPTPFFTPPSITPTPPSYQHLYYGVPKTGQTTSYHPENAPYDPGDDGQTQIGYPAEPPHWEDMGNGVIIDWATGLMWQQSSSYGQAFEGLQGTMNWEEAFRYVKGMNQSRFGGFSNWRIPNCLELLTTRNLEYDSTAWSVFTDTINDMYWSGTCSADFSSGTRVFMMSYCPGQLSTNTPDSLGSVRACRTFYDGVSPQGFPKTGQTIIIHPAYGYDRGDDGAIQAGFPMTGSRFKDNNDGTVTDNATGLIWQTGDSPEGKLWEDAFQYVSDLNRQVFAGYSDWRLPNQMELFSIVDYGQYNPAINSLFADTKSAYYWSSNTHKAASTAAWAVDFLSGGADVFPKIINQFSVRAVRGMPRAGLRPTPTPESPVLDSGIIMEMGLQI